MEFAYYEAYRGFRCRDGHVRQEDVYDADGYHSHHTIDEYRDVVCSTFAPASFITK